MSFYPKRQGIFMVLSLILFLSFYHETPSVLLGDINPRFAIQGDTLLVCDLANDRYAFLANPLTVGSLSQKVEWKDLPGINLALPPVTAEIDGKDTFILQDVMQRRFWEVSKDGIFQAGNYNNLGFHNFYLPNGQIIAVGSFKHRLQVALSPQKRILPLSSVMIERGRDNADFTVIPVPDSDRFLYLEPGDISIGHLVTFEGEISETIHFEWPEDDPAFSNEVRAKTDSLITIAMGFVFEPFIVLTTQDAGYLLHSYVFDRNGKLVYQLEEILVHMNAQGTALILTETDGVYALETVNL